MTKMVMSEFPGMLFTSAGYVKTDEALNDGKPYCTGDSISLNLRSQPMDEAFLKTHLKH